MLETVGKLLPVALAAALSTVPLTVLLMIMLRPQRSGRAAVPFALGCLVGTLAVVVLATLGAQFLPGARPRQADKVTGVVELVLGAALIVLGIRAWLDRHRASGKPPLPGWAMAAIDTVYGLRAFGLGVLIEFRPKSLILACVVGVQAHAAARGTTQALTIAVVYTVIATSTVTLPVLLRILAPKRMEHRLAKMADAMTSEGPLISAVVLIMIGAVVLGSGLQGLA